MFENMLMILLGICILLIGGMNFTGNISTIHWYNRKKVTKENAKQYAKVIGIGTMLIGLALVLTAIINIFIEWEYVFYLLSVSIILGIIIILFGQFKYNKGIF